MKNKRRIHLYDGQDILRKTPSRLDNLIDGLMGLHLLNGDQGAVEK